PVSPPWLSSSPTSSASSRAEIGATDASVGSLVCCRFTLCAGASAPPIKEGENGANQADVGFGGSVNHECDDIAPGARHPDGRPWSGCGPRPRGRPRHGRRETSVRRAGGWPFALRLRALPCSPPLG